MRDVTLADGQAALTRLLEDGPDIVLLDWRLPGISGIEGCRQIRRAPRARHLSILMLTARTGEDDSVRGLDAGADVYLTKPFSIDMLSARMAALLRRARSRPAEATLRFHDVVINLDEHRVERNDRTVRLGPTDYRLLELLVRHPGRVFSRDDLLDALWGKAIHVEMRTVDVHIKRLRKELCKPGEIDLVQTLRGEGYMLALETPPRRSRKVIA